MNQDQNQKISTAAAAVHAAFFMEGLIMYNGLIKCVDAWDNGAIELVSELTSYTDCLQDMLRVVNEFDPNIEWPGVFDYEVSSYFGKWFGKQVIANSDVPSKAVAEKWLAEDILVFFAKGMSHDDIVRLEVLLNNLCSSRNPS
jgi:hypothetical protein